MLQSLLQNFIFDDFGMSNFYIGPDNYRNSYYNHDYSQYRYNYGNFSFPVDHDDQALTNDLRRTSLTGHTPHRLSRQLSRPRVPVENDIAETDDTFAPALSASRATIPIPVEHETIPKVPYRTADFETTRPLKTQHRPAGHNIKAYNENVLNGFESLNLHGTQMANYGLSSNFSFPEYDPTKYLEPPISQSQEIRQTTLTTKDTKASTGEQTSLQSSQEKKTDKKKLSKCEEQEIEMKAQDKFIKEKYKLYRYHIIPDGNCLYRAVAQAVLLDQNQHVVLRQVTVDHIRENKEEFKEIIEGDMDKFLTEAAREGVWAGYPEILAMSRWLDININITTGGSPSNRTIATILHYLPTPDPKEIDSRKLTKRQISTERQSIWLSWLSSGHYDTLMDKIMENKEYDAWIRSRDSRIKSDEAMANEIYASDNRNRSRETYDNPTDIPRNANHDLPPSYDSIVSQADSKTAYNSQIGAFWDAGNLNDPLPPFEYPQPTQSLSRPEVTHNSPPKNTSLTDCDEELARALHEEEKFKLNMRSGYYV